MERIKNALLPASIIYNPTSPENNAAHIFADGERMFQGIPGIESTPGGHIYFGFYSGKDTERPGNFVLLYRKKISDLPGDITEKPLLAVVPPTEDTRCFDEVLWLDPLGRLWLIWSQSCALNASNWENDENAPKISTVVDGRMGVWCSVCDDPDADEPKFSAPRRIANGIMMNKPCVTKDGAWLFPCTIWSPKGVTDRYYADIPEEKYSNVYRTADNGETFELIGHSAYENRSLDEHMIFERRDRSLVMYIRSNNGIGQAESHDGGVTWQNECDSGLGGPDSRFHVTRLRSGALLLINHANYTRRDHLSAMLSFDDGKTWTKPLCFDERTGVSYPDVTERNGRLYIIYDRDRTGEREILLAILSEADILHGKVVMPGSRTKIVLNKAYGRRD